MIYTFRDCILDGHRHTLVRSGAEQKVEPQVFDLIHHLVQHPGNLVTRDDLIEAVWKGRIVSESTIGARIASARKAVGDDGKAQSVIETVQRRGVRFVAPVETNQPAPTVSGHPVPTPISEQAPRVRYVTVEDGSRLAWAVAGSGSPIMRASHGFTNLDTEWTAPSDAPFLHVVAAHHTLIRHDDRGSGLTEATEIDVTPERTAADIAAVADAAGFERISLYSESGGATDAIAFAALYPDRIDKLMLVGGYAKGWHHRGTGEAVDEPLRDLFLQGWDTPNSPFIHASVSGYFPDGPADLVREMAAYMQTTCSVEAVAVRRNRINTINVSHYLPMIKAETLVVHSRHDSIHPLRQARKMAAEIPNAELLVYDTANHMPLPGHHLWDQYVADFLEFFRDS